MRGSGSKPNHTRKRNYPNSGRSVPSFAGEIGPAELRKYEFPLRTKIDPESDHKDGWNFRVENLPTPAKTERTPDKKAWVKKVTFSESKVTLSFEEAMNRVLADDDESKFVLVSFSNFRIPEFPPRVASNYMFEFLKSGLRLNGKWYNFYGHSNSQLKSRTCFLYEGSPDLIRKKIEALGDFSKLNSPGKRAKRIGLLFSSADGTLALKEKDTEDIEDIETNGCNFSDGCGMMSAKFANEIARELNLSVENRKLVPSVVQIRYKGYKGVLMMNPQLMKKVAFRSSMRKFKGSSNETFGVLEYSKPFTYGFLNGEIVTLLSALGVGDQVFLALQDQYLEKLKNALSDQQTAFYFLCAKERFDLAEDVALEGLTKKVREQVGSLIKMELKTFYKNKNGVEKEKVRIWMVNSRILFGVCDYTGTLQEGECHVRITHESKGPLSLSGAEVVVTRNPCLHPGDIRKFKVVENRALNHLVDCIVFPTKGERDPASLMSGGDLDGDKFFVCWDKRVIPEAICEPYGYPPAKEVTKRNLTQEEMIRYFAFYNNASLGKVKNLYLEWLKASPEGANSSQCQELNKLFSSSVDGERIKIPEHLEKVPKSEENETFILEKLIENFSKKRKIVDEALANNALPEAETESDFDYLEFLLQAETLPAMMDEYRLFQLVLKYVRNRKGDMADYLPYFDFNSFTTVQKNAVLTALGEEDKRRPIKMKKLKDQWIGPIFNDLNNSVVLQPCLHSVRKFNLLDPRIRWQLLYSSDQDGGVRLYERLSRGLEDFLDTLVVFEPRGDLRVAMYFPSKLEKGENVVQEKKPLKLFSFDPDNDKAYKETTRPGYIVSFDGEIVQIYESRRKDGSSGRGRGGRGGSRGGRGGLKPPQPGSVKSDKANTFIWFALNERFSERNSTVDKCNFKTSIALQKFSQELSRDRDRLQKAHGQGIEIYVISNRDREGCQILDILDNKVETLRVIRNVQNVPREYELPGWTKDAVDMKDREFLKTVFFTSQQEMAEAIKGFTEDEIIQVLELCCEMEDKFRWEESTKGRFSKVFQEVSGRADAVDIFSRNLNMLQKCVEILPSLVVIDKMLQFAELFKENSDFIAQMIKALLFCTQEVKRLSEDFFKSLISFYGEPSFSELCDLTKLIAFTVRYPDIARDMVSSLFPAGEESSEDPAVSYGRRFLRSLIVNYIDEISEAEDGCPCDQNGIPLGAEELVRNEGVLLRNEEKTNIPSPSRPLLSDFFTSSSNSENGHKERDPTRNNAKLKHLVQLNLEIKEERPGLFSTLLRTDIPGRPVQSEDHVRFVVAKRPTGQESLRPLLPTFDALVTSAKQGKVEFFIVQRPVPLQLKAATWNLFFCGKTTNLNAELFAIQKLVMEKYGASVAAPVILGESEEGRRDVFHEMEEQYRKPVEIEQGKFNEMQERAIRTALENKMTLVWGPPGTGKTTVVVEIIKQFCARGCRILVTASTHKAVDNIMERYVRGPLGTENDCVIRLTSDTQKVSSSLKNWTMDAFVGADLNSDDKAKREARKRLKAARVLFATCSGAGVGLLRESAGQPEESPFSVIVSDPEEDSKKKKEKKEEIFDVVIVDEASQLTEPNCLVPLVKRSKYVVLVGDDVQLAPTVKSKTVKRELETSLFARLRNDQDLNGKVETVMLTTQYRMSSTLVHFPSRTFYGGKLLSGAQEERTKLPDCWKWKKPTIFLPCSKPETNGASKSNQGQIELTLDVLKFLREQCLDVVVLTPYKEHKVKTLEKLGGQGSGKLKVTVNTIDEFQGREADVVIFATVRCNVQREIGFLRDIRRINVAVTRAKKALILIGDEDTLTLWNENGRRKAIEPGEEKEVETAKKVLKEMVQGEDCQRVEWKELKGSMANVGKSQENPGEKKTKEKDTKKGKK